MKGVTVIYQPKDLSSYTRLPNEICREFALTPNETWLLLKLVSHSSGVFAPSLEEMEQAGRAEGYAGMPAERALTTAFNGLVDKGYAQKRRVRVPGTGNVWVRSVTLVPFRFAVDLSPAGAVSDAELADMVTKHNAVGRRPDVVGQAYARKAARERKVARTVVSLASRRKSGTLNSDAESAAG